MVAFRGGRSKQKQTRCRLRQRLIRHARDRKVKRESGEKGMAFRFSCPRLQNRTIGKERRIGRTIALADAILEHTRVRGGDWRKRWAFADWRVAEEFMPAADKKRIFEAEKKLQEMQTNIVEPAVIEADRNFRAQVLGNSGVGVCV